MHEVPHPLVPPSDEPKLETVDGLKYWLKQEGNKIGLVQSVLTEDPSISMHHYSGGGRDTPATYLFRYRGSEIGFVCNDIADGLPLPQTAVEKDLDRGVFIQTVTGVGTPVYDHSVMFEKAPDGRVKFDGKGRPQRDRMSVHSESLVCGPSWEEYATGERGKFRSAQHQAEMLRIWPELFNGLSGALWRLRQDDPKGLAPDMRFSDSVLQEFESGRLIDGDQ